MMLLVQFFCFDEVLRSFYTSCKRYVKLKLRLNRDLLMLLIVKNVLNVKASNQVLLLI